MLESKLNIPRLAQRILPRLHLTNLLEQNAIQRKLILVSAPAGYGKTTLLANWASVSSLPVAWLTITGEEDDPEDFLRYLLAAWKKIQPDLDQTQLDILLGARGPDLKAVLSAFLNAGEQLPRHLVFVLDDFHLIKNPAVHEAFTFLLDHLSPKLHFILTSRSDPPLPVARYRARRQLTELRIPDLRFTQAESREFLTRSLDLELSPNQISALQAKTEGWAAGLLLAALAFPEQEARAGELTLVSGRQRFIADYLGEDVLSKLSEDRRNFLLRTSILDRLCAPLCEAVAGVNDGQAMLEALERNNLFLVQLDNRREWFRYHSLFAGFLAGELRQQMPGEIRQLHVQAAGWYLEHELPEQAFHHAIEGGSAGLVNRILERYLAVKLLGGEVKVVQQWLASLPEAWLSSYPMVMIAQAGFLLINGRFSDCVRFLDQAEQLAREQENDDFEVQLARVTALRCNVACFQNDLARAETYAAKALEGLPEADLDFQAGIYGALGDTYRRNGRWEEAKAAYQKLLDFTHAPSFTVEAAHLYGALADLALRQGHLQAATEYWRKALASIQEEKNWGHIPLPVTGWVYIRLAELLYEANQLVEARHHLMKGMERAELGGDVRSLIAGCLISSRLNLTEGNIPAAEDNLNRARPYIENTQFPQFVSHFERIQLEVWLAQDRLRAAVDWSDQRLHDERLDKQPERAGARLAMARVLVVRGDGDSLRRAQAVLQALIEIAHEEGRMGDQIEALAILALSFWQGGDRAKAVIALEHALRLAEPEGYIRLFADLGLPMARLLQEAQSREVLPEYVSGLLAAFNLNLASPREATLPEPLTPREEQVLQLIAAGLTNQEIAEELVISPETVKKHTSHIYGKLSVNNRTEATARARVLDLLE